MKNNCDNDLMHTPKITKRELELNDSKLELSMRTFAGCHTDTRVRQNVSVLFSCLNKRTRSLPSERVTVSQHFLPSSKWICTFENYKKIQKLLI